MNKYYCYVTVDNERRYFSDCDLKKANITAQNEANRTGKPVKRQNYADSGYSLFYPR